MKAGGSLDFTKLLEEEGATTDANDAPQQPEGQAGATGGGGAEGGTGSKPSGGKRPVRLSHSYDVLLDAAGALPADAWFDRTRHLARKPRWVELRRVAGGRDGYGGRGPPRSSDEEELPLPRLPPRPPTSRMKPIENLRPQELRGRWVSSNEQASRPARPRYAPPATRGGERPARPSAKGGRGVARPRAHGNKLD